MRLIIDRNNFKKTINSEMGRRHAAIFRHMLDRRVDRFQLKPAVPKRYTSVVLPATSTQIDSRINQMAGAFAARIAPHLGLTTAGIDFKSGRENRHVTLFSVKSGEFKRGETSFQELGERLRGILPDVSLRLHLAGLLFFLEPARGVNFAVGVYISDEDLGQILDARAAIGRALQGVPEIREHLNLWLPDEPTPTDNERVEAYHTHVSILRVRPKIKSYPFGPLVGTALGNILNEAANPANNYVCTLEVNFSDFVLRHGIGPEMKMDPNNPDIKL